MAKILVTGASGMLGRTLVPVLRDHGFEVVAHGYMNACDIVADLTDDGAAESLIKRTKPDAIINLVGLTNVDGCERNPDLAYRLNIRTVESLAAAITSCRAMAFLHISTDQVYDGEGPHSEESTGIVNTYGLSKYAGEIAALRAGATVLRTNFFGPSQLPGRLSFSDWLIEKFRSRDTFTGFSDVLFSPLMMSTLSAAMADVITRPVPGVFNLGSRHGMSKAAFAANLAEQLNLDVSAMRIGVRDDIHGHARRPRDMTMDCNRFERTFDLVLPDLLAEIGKLERNDAGAER